MEQYQIRLAEPFTMEHLLDKLSLRIWMMIQGDLRSQCRTLNTYRKLSEKLTRNFEDHIRSYDVCGNGCICNEVVLTKPLSPDWELENIKSQDTIYQLFVGKTFDDFIEMVAKDLSKILRKEIQFGRHQRVRTKLSTVLKCVLGDHIVWNPLCRLNKRAACQPFSSSLIV